MAINKLKEIGGSAAGLLLMLAFLAIPVLLLFGAAQFSIWALDWIPDVIGIAILVCIVLVPLALIPAARGVAAGLFGLASFVFGVCLWLYSLAFTYIEWGMLAVVLGVLLAGVGVVFTGILAALFSATWGVLSNIAILLVLCVGTRFAASWLSESAERRLLLKRMQETPSEVVITRPPHQ
jgi:hypothetical protein